MSKVQTMPLEIWTDINGNAARTQFKGGTKYIRADAQATVKALQRERDDFRDVLQKIAHIPVDGEGRAYYWEGRDIAKEAIGLPTSERFTTMQAALDAERAALQKFYYSLNAGVEGGRHQEADEQQDIDRLMALLKTARQEALREAAKVVREWPWEQPAVHADPLRQARCRGNREASVDIAEALDRLASEGG